MLINKGGDMLIEKRQIKKNVESIILSIKYSCLLEEIRVLEQKLDIIGGKKIALGIKGKELEQKKQQIDDVNLVIDKIKDTNKPYIYSIFEKNQLADKLNLLSKSKNYKKLKYYIALETIFDADLINCKNKDALLENISIILFSNKSEIKEIERKIIEIYNYIADNKQEKDLPVADLVQMFAKIPIYKMLGFLKAYSPKFALVGGLAADFVLGRVTKKITQLKNAKRISKLPADNFLYELIRTAVALFYEKQEAFSSLEYQKKFRLYLKELNLTRNIILDNLYNKWQEVEKNQEKLKLLNKFDMFLLEKVKFHK